MISIGGELAFGRPVFDDGQPGLGPQFLKLPLDAGGQSTPAAFTCLLQLDELFEDFPAQFEQLPLVV